MRKFYKFTINSFLFAVSLSSRKLSTQVKSSMVNVSAVSIALEKQKETL